MTFPLFADLPEQREGPITVDGHVLVTCPTCGGDRKCVGWWGGGPDGEDCLTCNGGGKVLERTP